MKDRKRNKDKDRERDVPLCQTGPGGDFKSVFPESAIPVSDDKVPRGMAKLSRDLGLDVPLVSNGPEGIEWSREGLELKGIIARMMKVMRRIHIGDRNAELADRILVSEQISAADEALKLLQAKPVEKKKATGEILEKASTDAGAVALNVRGSNRITADDVYAAGTESVKVEKENEKCDSETDGDTPVYSQVHEGSWLFPDDAGDWRPPRAEQGNRVRTRRRTRKKRPSQPGSKAQGSLFTGL
jgi:hypothetical protein